MSLTAVIPTTYSPYASQNSYTDNSCVTEPACSETQTASSKSTDASQNNELTDEEKQQVQKLQTRDREVRAHERAHVAASGQYVRGGANFEYQTGPDDKRYAVGGEVSIDTSEVSGNPEATIQKMQIVRKAALAPAKPSAQDRAIAAQASQKEVQARQELRQEKSDEEKEDISNSEQINSKYSRKIGYYTKNGTTISAHSFFPSQHLIAIA